MPHPYLDIPIRMFRESISGKSQLTFTPDRCQLLITMRAPAKLFQHSYIRTESVSGESDLSFFFSRRFLAGLFLKASVKFDKMSDI